jgi:hypothetical protein
LSEETAYRMEKIFVSCSSDRGLISRISKQLKQVNTKRTNNPINKWANELRRHFLFIYFLIFIVLLFICAYNAWVISPPPRPHPLLYHPPHPLPSPPPPQYPAETILEKALFIRITNGQNT